MDYAKVGSQILECVGGQDNVSNLVHCMTRLRFNLKDDSQVNEEKLKKIKGVVGTVNKGGQYQVIIGNEVANVYKAIMAQGTFKADHSKGSGDKKGGVAVVFDTIAGIFTPMLPALMGAGMIKAILAILSLSGVLLETSQTYTILSALSDSVFYFMPMFLAYTAANKFRCNPFLAMTMAAFLLHPDLSALFNSGESIKFLGLPVTVATYSSSVIPIILTVWAMSYIERFAEKVSPTLIKTFLKPILVVLITAPLALIVIGPLGTIVGDGLAAAIGFVDSKASWLVPTIMGAFSPLIVMTGMHYSLIPMAMNNLTLNGFETILGPGMMASNVAQGAAGLAVALKTKNRDFRQVALSGGITGVLGITEPILYGCNMRLKKPLYAVLIGGGVGGFYAGITGIKSYAFISPGLFSLAGYITPNGSANFMNAVISMVLAIVVTFVMTLILGFEDVPVETEDEEVTVETNSVELTNEMIGCPIEGEVKPLSAVEDPTFGEGMMGNGIAIEPTVGKVVAPVDGTVQMVFKTKHAVAIKSDRGAEILIHVGMDTVQLGGKHFTTHVTEGQKVKKGDLLVEFDMNEIKKAGYPLTTPVVITNTPNYKAVKEVKLGQAKLKQSVIELEA